VPDKGIEVEAFQRAAKLGIHRTVHAGETGSAEMVKRVSGFSLLFSTVTAVLVTITYCSIIIIIQGLGLLTHSETTDLSC
jgi:hypothetical protein